MLPSETSLQLMFSYISCFGHGSNRIVTETIMQCIFYIQKVHNVLSHLFKKDCMYLLRMKEFYFAVGTKT